MRAKHPETDQRFTTEYPHQRATGILTPDEIKKWEDEN